MAHLTEQDLVLLAFGEAATDFGDASEHLRTCDRCAAELNAFQHIVELGRETDTGRGAAPSPPARVWTGIAQELALPTHPAPSDSPAADVPAGGADRRRNRRQLLVAAAVAAAALLGIGAGVVIGRATDGPPAAANTSSATLAPVPPAGPSEATGSANITRGPNGATLTVDTAHLPLQQGFYQVWLYDQAADKMVPIGTLDGTGHGTFTLTPSIDLRSYNIIDISAQQLNGDPAHGSSVLRGAIAQ